METKHTLHAVTDWAKARLDEMEASLAVLETKVHAAEAGARTKADAAIADMKKRRDAFKADTKDAMDASAEALHLHQANLEAEWQGFEADVEAYWASVGGKADEYQEVFQARVKAQQQAWKDTMTSVETATQTFEANRKAEVKAALEKAEHIAQNAGAKLDAFHEAGKTSWAVLHAALTESRSAFDAANAKAMAAIKAATKT